MGDGPRDAAVVPRIVETIVSMALDSQFVSWARLHRAGSGPGYGRKLMFAIRQARDLRRDGVVATLDCDREPRGRRLNELRSARTMDRTRTMPLPTAVGEAVPHLEAWLLDDPHAVRIALGLAADVRVSSVRRTKDPKSALQRLIQVSDCNDALLDILAAIAKQLDPQRCRNAKHTGFEEFADDVHTEFGNV